VSLSRYAQHRVRAHVRAALRGDTTETARLRHRIWPEYLLDRAEHFGRDTTRGVFAAPWSPV